MESVREEEIFAFLSFAHVPEHGLMIYCSFTRVLSVTHRSELVSRVLLSMFALQGKRKPAKGVVHPRTHPISALMILPRAFVFAFLSHAVYRLLADQISKSDPSLITYSGSALSPYPPLSLCTSIPSSQ